MKIAATLQSSSRALIWTVLGVLAIGTLLPLISQPAIAQVNPVDPLEGTQSGERSSDPFSNTGGGQESSVLGLIHRAMIGDIRSSSEFQQDQHESIGSAALDFRNRQLELLQQQNQSTGTAPVTTPTQGN